LLPEQTAECQEVYSVHTLVMQCHCKKQPVPSDSQNWPKGTDTKTGQTMQSIAIQRTIADLQRNREGAGGSGQRKMMVMHEEASVSQVAWRFKASPKMSTFQSAQWHLKLTQGQAI
jgi:hypothetical protein